jgi:uncharacterized membrane protein
MVGLGDLAGGSFRSFAFGVSGDGSVVVGQGSSSNGTEAFRWTSGGGMESLMDVLIAEGVDVSDWNSLTRAEAVSADGNTIVGYGINAAGNTEAFIAIVPEPSSLLYFGGAIGAFVCRRRRIRNVWQ